MTKISNLLSLVLSQVLERRYLQILLFAFSCLLAGCSTPYEFKGTAYDPAESAPEIAGLIGEQEPFLLSDLNGKTRILFFGYTFCPDICPLTLSDMREVIQSLGDDAERIAVVFVSVDPKRDTPEQLAAYVGSFHDSFVGVHIPLPQLDQVKKEYFIFSEKEYSTDDKDSQNYLITHTGWIYIIDQNGLLRVLHSTDSTPEEIAADVQYLIAN